MNAPDIQPILDKAVETGDTLIVETDTHAAAVVWRRRAYAFRKAAQRASEDIYPPGHMARGTSPYDNLILKITSDNHVEVSTYVNRFPVRTQDGRLVDL